MHRFMTLKNLHFESVSSHGKGLQYSRSCTLCNRITSPSPFTADVGSFRIHSTWLNPEQRALIINKKNRTYKIAGNFQRLNVKSKRKMKITVLEELDNKNQASDNVISTKSFLTSSKTSPVFSLPDFRNVGITIMLPPNSTRKVNPQVSTPASNHSEQTPGIGQSTALSQVAFDLMFNTITRNRVLTRDYFSPNAEAKSTRINKDTKQVPDIPIIPLCVNVGPRRRGRREETSQEGVSSIESTSMDNLRKKDTPLAKQLVLRGNITKQKRILRRAAYIDVCLHSGKEKKALTYASKGLQLFPNVPSRNIILEPLFCRAAQEKNPAAVTHALILAKKYNTPLTPASYVVIFEMLATVPQTKENLDIAKTLVFNMKKDNVSIDDLVKCCNGRKLLVDRVLKSIESTGTNCKDYSESNCVKYPVADKDKTDSYCSPASGLLPEGSAEKLVNEQISIHSSFVYKLKNIACTLSGSEIDDLATIQTEVEDSWREALIAAYQTNLVTLKSDKSGFQLTCFLEALPPEIYAEIILQEIHNRIEDSTKQSIGFVFAQLTLGRRVKQFYDLEVLKKYGILNKAKEAHIEFAKKYLSPERCEPGPTNPRELWDTIVGEMDYHDTNGAFLLREWYPELYLKIGKFLYDIMLKDVKIDENLGIEGAKPHMVPALYVVFRKTTRGYQKQLKMHPAVHQAFPNKMQPFLKMDSYDLPMVCPPRPWINGTNGVYPLSSPLFQRFPETNIGAEALLENIAGAPAENLYPSLDSLNQLGSVPWKINNEVLDVVTEVFHSGGSEELSIPAPPSAAIPEPPMPSNMSLEARLKITKERHNIREDNAAMYSQWCDTLYKLCIAHEFRDRVFWLGHNMDFRGRVYPLCPHLQHMSNDMSRSLLSFAKGEKLGPDGLDWLKLHTINLIGEMGRQSLAARLAYANEMMPKILDSAEKPLTGEKWWMNSEYPWQTLGACKEIAAAVASGDPANYVSHFPVHQDGSCNGLQHYAAMGRDTLGARAVNLVDSDIPSDVYSVVADLVEKRRAQDAADGDAMARSLEGFIARKVVKQTVMTTVYGVTNFGAQLQIRKQLNALKYPAAAVPPASLYICKLVFQSLGEMFTTSRQTMEWLYNCANGIVKSKNMPVKWVTPLGLPVVQPYFQKRFAKIKESSDVSTDEWIDPAQFRLPVLMKQRNAFSPNFVHSLDSCHMILTGLHCEQADITFVSVHDCYWVHAKNVTAMSKICREQFVALHSQPILEDLSKYLLETYAARDIVGIKGVEERRLQRLFASLPIKGDFDLNEVLRSKYFFS